jgi:hypothetical protein
MGRVCRAKRGTRLCMGLAYGKDVSSANYEECFPQPADNKATPTRHGTRTPEGAFDSSYRGYTTAQIQTCGDVWYWHVCIF